jgi:hypothetical protein
MARFIGSVQGQRGEASRLGSSNSGIDVSAKGWDVGISIHGWVGENGEDVFSVSLNSGSNGRKSEVFIGNFTEKDLGRKS